MRKYHTLDEDTDKLTTLNAIQDAFRALIQKRQEGGTEGWKAEKQFRWY